jgi:glycine betaine/proline transport system ATP-binding protein
MVFKVWFLPHRTILENAAFGLEIREARERDEKSLKALETVGLKG